MGNYTDQTERIHKAMMIAREKAKSEVIAFILTTPKIPMNSGYMITSAVNSIMSTGKGLSFEMLIHFNTNYADLLDRRTGFLNNIQPDINEIVERCIRQSLDAAGIKATVNING